MRGFIDRGDVPSAMALLEAVDRDGPAGEAAPLSSEKVGALRRAIERTADQARRAERRAVDALMEDHLASIQATGAGIHDIAERARAALDRNAFEAFQRKEKDAHAFHETMKSLKFAGPEVIGRELESRRPKEGARNFDEKQRRFELLRRGAARMLRLRDRDGAAFVMEMGDVKAAVEGAGADGPDRRRALKFRMAMQADIGMPEDRVRLLTRAEAGALADQVQSAAVEDRAAKVAGLQDLYGPLFGRAMKELIQPTFPHIPSKFVEIVPLSHRQGNCIPYAAIRWHDFGNRPALGRPLGHFSRHPDTPLLSLSPRRRFPRPTPERVFVADHQSSSGFSGTGPSAPPPQPIGT